MDEFTASLGPFLTDQRGFRPDTDWNKVYRLIKDASDIASRTIVFRVLQETEPETLKK
jgi:hypothetical protein